MTFEELSRINETGAPTFDIFVRCDFSRVMRGGAGEPVRPVGAGGTRTQHLYLIRRGTHHFRRHCRRHAGNSGMGMDGTRMERAVC